MNKRKYEKNNTFSKSTNSMLRKMLLIRTLEEGEFLNDIIIDFYLNFLHEEVLNIEDRQNVYVFR